MRPCALRPPFFGSGRTSDFSGSVRVTSTKSATLAPRRPGVVGLYLRMPIFFVHPLFRLRTVFRSGPDLRWAYVPEGAHARPRPGAAHSGGVGHETGPPKMSIRSPSARLTMARLVSLRLP